MERRRLNDRLVRTEGEIERDRAIIAHAYLIATPIAEIAEKMNLSPAVIYKDLSVIREGWRSAAIGDFNERINMELAKIDALEEECWNEWRVSRQESERQKKETRTSQRTSWTILQATKQMRPIGDHNYIVAIQWCIDRRIKLLGLDAPTKIAPTNPEGDQPYDPVSDKTRVALLLSAFIAGGSHPDDDAGRDARISGDIIEQ